MKGALFNVVQDVVEAEFGPEAWDEAVTRAGVDGVYTSLGSYADDELAALVGALSEIARCSRDDVLVLAGRKGLAVLVARHADLIEDLDGWRGVLRGLDGIIHPEVQKIYPDAEVPSFEVVCDDAVFQLVYRSSRNMCKLAEGLIVGLGEHFGVDLSVTQPSCAVRGDTRCLIEVAEP